MCVGRGSQQIRLPSHAADPSTVSVRPDKTPYLIGRKSTVPKEFVPRRCECLFGKCKKLKVKKGMIRNETVVKGWSGGGFVSQRRAFLKVIDVEVRIVTEGDLSPSLLFLF